MCPPGSWGFPILREHTIHLPNSRKLQALEDGDPNGLPVFFLHGTPGCRYHYAPAMVDAAKQGIRLIGYDRPGFGGSTPAPGRRVADAAADVAALAEDLGIDRFAVWGHSGGAPPALACAATLPDRVVAVASSAGTAPYSAEVLDWTADMSALKVNYVRMMFDDRLAWEEMVRKDREELLAMTPDQLRNTDAPWLPQVDRVVMTPELLEALDRSAREGLKNGEEGSRDDSLATMGPWGFDPADIRVPVQLWYAGQDPGVPISHGRWLAARIPGAELHVEPDEGHLSIYVHRLSDIHAWLVSKF